MGSKPSWKLVQSMRDYALRQGEDLSTIEACHRLIYEPDRKKAYLSFPITHVMDMPDVLGEIAKFREIMKNSFTCFDPADVEEAYLPFHAGIKRNALAIPEPTRQTR